MDLFMKLSRTLLKLHNQFPVRSPPLEVAEALSSFMNLKYTEGNFFHFLLKFISRAWCGQIVLASAAVTIFQHTPELFASNGINRANSFWMIQIRKLSHFNLFISEAKREEKVGKTSRPELFAPSLVTVTARQMNKRNVKKGTENLSLSIKIQKIPLKLRSRVSVSFE